MPGEEWREQTPEEREIIATLLRVPFPGRDEVRAQVEGRPVALDCECGCGSLRFDIPAGAPRASERNDWLEVEGRDAEGRMVAAFFMVEGGRVKCLEFWWPDGEPAGLPLPSSLRILYPVRSSDGHAQLIPGDATIMEEYSE